jgi:CxxC-x17-CxxC domain-containing protein
MPKRNPQSVPPSPGTLSDQKPGSVLVQKRGAVTEPTLRDKLCATCGKPFSVTPDQRFFMCPRCYQKSLPPRKSARQGETQLLTQIRCVECGIEEYVSFVPQDPQATYCRACFAKRKRKPVQE